eukprot:3812190-Pyramimonas_sp.AAC.1
MHRLRLSEPPGPGQRDDEDLQARRMRHSGEAQRRLLSGECPRQEHRFQERGGALHGGASAATLDQEAFQTP